MPGRIWHPYTQMQTAPIPIEIERAEGSWLYTRDGRKILDGISSWWVNVHGHCHPDVAKAIADQAGKLEQVIFAGFTHAPAEKLSRRLVEKLPPKINTIFFSDDGSTAVEVSLKMAWQYWQMRGEARSKLIALEHAYHGDTFGAMAVSGRSLFTKAFEPLLFDVDFIPSPAEVSIEVLEEKLETLCKSGEVAAIILEPLLQAAGGMLMYSAETLDRIVNTCRKHGVLVIFDEVMTGFGRTGKLFAADHCDAKPDIMCLSKGLTAGFVPMSITACSDEIYDAFLSEDRMKTLFHGHSFTANPIACAAANAGLTLFESEATWDKISMIEDRFGNFIKENPIHSKVKNLRQTGTVLAMDIETDKENGYLDEIGPRLQSYFLEQNVLLRPLGNVVYFMPPYSTNEAEIDKTLDLIVRGLNKYIP